jgi:amino acid transporter
MERDMNEKQPLLKRLKTIIIGDPHSPKDQRIFHQLSLIAFFAWVGLGADGLSSSCYGPQEAFLALQGHEYLAIFVALGTAITIFVICASYNQIIELFPTGGGGYLVASKLLSPQLGMIAGCALLIDYMLTITVSIASGADAIFSFLPVSWQTYKVTFALVVIVLITVLNLRGVKESVLPLVPIFIIFVITHVFAILYTLFTHWLNLSEVASATVVEIQRSRTELGLAGMFFLIMRAYSMGAGTYTGIEAVSNSLPLLREPKVQTAHRTMRYMAFSLAFTVVGLMLAFLLYRVDFQAGKTLNAVFFERLTAGWGTSGYLFLLVTLISEATILFVAAQTGFLGGPQVLSNMALDRWVPTRFTMLSDRLVTQNGILIMGVSAFLLMIFTQGSVQFLVVLYSINVFITFALSQLGMVRHWLKVRAEALSWKKKLFVNGVGLSLTLFILISVVTIKFNEGGWITLLVTGSLVVLCFATKRHYSKTSQLLQRLDNLIVDVVESTKPKYNREAAAELKQPSGFDPREKTAVVLVSGFNGMGLHTLFGVLRTFEGVYKNYVFVLVGAVDTGSFKGAEQIEQLQAHIKSEINRYVLFMRRQGFCADGYSSIAVDVVDEIAQLAPKILEVYPQAVFFGGQLVFPEDPFLSRWLHNYTIFTIQKRLYQQGMLVVIMPIRV